MESTEGENLFNINKSGKRLSEDRDILFHRIVANLIFVSKHTRPEIHTTIELLTNKMRETYEYILKIFRRLLHHLHGTCEMAPHLNSGDLNNIH